MESFDVIYYAALQVVIISSANGVCRYHFDDPYGAR